MRATSLTWPASPTFAPIIAGDADIVVGDRRPHQNRKFSWVQRPLPRIGSRIVALAGAQVATDATSGFRAYTREAALKLVAVDRYTYAVESTGQAGLSPFRRVRVPARTNPKTRDSRLVRFVFSRVRRNALTIRVFATYLPSHFFDTFTLLPAIGALVAFMPCLRTRIVDGRTGGNLQFIIPVRFFRSHLYSCSKGSVEEFGSSADTSEVWRSRYGAVVKVVLVRNTAAIRYPNFTSQRLSRNGMPVCYVTSQNL